MLFAAGQRFDASIEAKLDYWVVAKREKDFATADAIRAELQQLGIAPEVVRPSERDAHHLSGGDCGGALDCAGGFGGSFGVGGASSSSAGGGPRYDFAIEAKLDRWVIAKREKDFAAADAIRSELRGLGIDPDTARPSEKLAVKGLAARLATAGPLGLGQQHHAEASVPFGMQSTLLSDPFIGRHFGQQTYGQSSLGHQGLLQQTLGHSGSSQAMFGLQAFTNGACGAAPMQQPGYGQMAFGLSAASAFGGNAAPAQRHDLATEQALDNWVIAKREKEFATADAIRSELRAQGIEPEFARPCGGSSASSARASAPMAASWGAASITLNRAGARFDPIVQSKLDRWVAAKREQEMTPATPMAPDVEAKLDRWVMAKREKDWALADSIRSELRSVGVEPDQVRPPGSETAATSVASGSTHMLFDRDTEEKLERWVAAKRENNFILADSLRSELRARGVEPDSVWSPQHQLHSSSGLDMATEAKLDRWVMAKREKDFATADALRSELRAAGLEPDHLRPPGREMSGSPTMVAKLYDPMTEALLDQWVIAKRDKDFARADVLRKELRSQGIEPDFARPSEKSTSSMQQVSNNWGYLSDGQLPGGFGVAAMPQMSMSSMSSRAPARVYDADTESKLDMWVIAKREKDFGTADALRSQLRALGVDPDIARPSQKDSTWGRGGGRGVEANLGSRARSRSRGLR